METIGRYRIKKPLGRGGMAEVFLAHDPLIKRDVAVKVFNAESFHGGRASLDVFHREAESAGRLSHPNIVTIYDIGEDRGVPFIVMEYLAGPSLAALLGQAVHFPFAEAAAVVIQLCSALEYAHRNGVVHRDIKPGNIIRLADGTVKLTDFGIARMIGGPGRGDARAGAGTPGYMSPEEIDGGRVDARSDIFSAGVILYELLTGRRAFKGAGLEEIHRQIAKLELAALSKVERGVPPGADAVVFRAMAFEPDRRYQGASDFKTALETLRGRAGPAGQAADKPPLIPSEGPFEAEAGTAPAGRRRLLPRLLLIGGAGLLAVLVWAVVVHRSRPAAPFHASSAPVEAPPRGAPPSVEADLSAAGSLAKSSRPEDWQAALRIYDGVIRRGKDPSKALFGQGEVYFRQGLFAVAREAYEKAVASDRNLARAHVMIARCLLEEFRRYKKDPKDLEAALSACRAASERSPWLEEEAQQVAGEIEGERRRLALSAAVVTPRRDAATASPSAPPAAQGFGTLALNTQPPATVSIYSGETGRLVADKVEVPAGNIRLPAGAYMLVFSILATGEKIQEKLIISPDRLQPVKKVFEARVSVNSIPYADIFVDDKTKLEPPAQVTLLAGTHRFRAEMKDGRKQEKQVVILYGEPNSVSFKW